MKTIIMIENPVESGKRHGNWDFAVVERDYVVAMRSRAWV